MSFNMAHRSGFKFSFSLLSIVIACLVSGCAGDSDLADVRGIVTLDGQPLPDAFIRFTPEADGAASFGKTEADGSYRMKFSDSEYGVFIGSNSVKIGTGDIKADNSGRIPELVPKIYNSETTLKKDEHVRF